MGDFVKREIKPFNEFWVNCESTMLHSLLITLDEKYRVMSYVVLCQDLVQNKMRGSAS